jgi:hypothetical protein
VSETPQYLLIVATVVASIAACVSAIAGFGAIREMRRDREERTRPAVLLDIDADEKGAIWCRLLNYGNGIARNVRVEFSPVPSDYQKRPLSSLSWIQNPLLLVPPGKEFRQFFMITSELLKRPETDRKFSATVRYQGDNGTEHCQTFHFDFDSLKHLQLPPKTQLYYLEKLHQAAVGSGIKVDITSKH